MKILFNTILILATLVSLTFVESCKPDSPPKLRVTAVDSAGTAVAGATLKITSNGTKGSGNVTADGTTGSDGTAEFEFRLDAVVRIDAYKVIAAGDSIKGTTASKVEMNKTNEATVTLKRVR